MTTPNWDAAYTGSVPAPWDIGRPQPAFLRARYVASLASVLHPGGHCHLMCFSDRQPGTLGPRRVTQAELRAAFSDGWTIVGVVPDAFEVNPDAFGSATAQAWLADISRDAPVRA
jgi:Thiopurine S-methyltransferase (TPMT)